MNTPSRLSAVRAHRQACAVIGATIFVSSVASTLAGWVTNSYELAGHRHELAGHHAAPHGVVFVDNHELVATACADLHLYLFSAADGTLLRRVGGHSKRLTSISSYDGADEVATGSADGTIKIWSLPSGTERRSIRAHAGSVLAVRFSHNGSSLASVGKDEVLRIWDSTSGDFVREISCPLPNGTLAIGAAGRLIAANGSDNDLIVWSVDSGGELTHLSGGAAATSACFSSDATCLAVGRQDGGLEIWDCGSWTRRVYWSKHKKGVTDVAFSRDGKSLFSSSHDRTIGVWSPDIGAHVGFIKGHPKPVLCVATSNSGAVASGGYGPSAMLWTDPSAAAE